MRKRHAFLAIIIICLIPHLSACKSENNEMVLSRGDGGIRYSQALGCEENITVSSIQKLNPYSFNKDLILSTDELHTYNVVEDFDGIQLVSQLYFVKDKSDFVFAGYGSMITFSEWPSETERDLITRISDNLYSVYGEDTEGRSRFMIPEKRIGMSPEAMWKTGKDRLTSINFGMVDSVYRFSLGDHMMSYYK